jgi:hypothetical protein
VGSIFQEIHFLATVAQLPDPQHAVKDADYAVANGIAMI